MKIQLLSNNILKTAILVFCTFSIISCKKELVQNDGNTELVFTITGMKEAETIGSKQSFANNSIAKNQMQLEDDALSRTKLGNVDLISYALEEDIKISFDNDKISHIADLDPKKKLAAENIPMDDGIKYMILIYNNSTNAFVNATLGTAGQPIKIDVPKNATYKWYAYSYNTTANIPIPTNTSSPSIPTPSNTDLLYDSDIINVGVAGDYPIKILFEHKLALIQIELDYDRLFAQIKSYDLEISSLNIFNTGTFNILDGSTTGITPYTITDNINQYLEDHPNGEKIKLAKFYIADPTPAAATFNIKIKQLSVQYASATPTTPTELVGPSGTTASATLAFGPFTPSKGRRFIAKVKLWYNFAPRTILHVTRYEAEIYGYAAQPYYNGIAFNRASYNMINEPRNYGLLTNSVVRTKPFTHDRCSVNGTLSTFLTAATKPDITIISVYYRMDADDRTALKNYINAGGVVLLMTDGINDIDRNAQEPFFQDFFNTPSIVLGESGFLRGSLYAFKNINDEILNGPFGDLRPNKSNEPKYWGEDASATTTLQNIPTDQITYYSEATPANRTGSASGVTMFKHNYKNFFWIGDGGFLSNAAARGVYVAGDYGICPFATDATTNYPIPKTYGEGNKTGWTGSAGRRPVYNSVLFANVMSWAIANAEFFGINTGGLPADPADYVIF